MSFCPRIVILLDESQCGRKETMISNIHLGCLRLLTYFSHTFNRTNIKTSLLWGYKFYNSTKQQRNINYRQCPFLDYTTNNFDKFEKELYERLTTGLTVKENATVKCGDQLKAALTELISDFQWDRPELFSPGKKLTDVQSYNVDVVNIVFLFSACPKISQEYYNTTYFSKVYSNAESFMNLLFPGVLYDKFMQYSKISLCWVDTACFSKQMSVCPEHIKLGEGMKLVKGCVISLQQLSQWWTGCSNDNKLYNSDVISVSSLMEGLLTVVLKTSDYDHSMVAVKTCNLLWKGNFDCPTISMKYHPVKKQTNILSLKHVVVRKKISLNTISPRDLCHELTPFICILDDTETGNHKEQRILKELINSKEALLVKFSMSTSSKEYDGIITAYTSHVMSLTKLKATTLMDLKQSGVDTDCDFTTEVKNTLTKQDTKISFVNAADDWFFYNPLLGFPLSFKNATREIEHEVVTNNENREENSKQLISFMKDVMKKKKKIAEEKLNTDQPDKKLKLRKANRLKGLSWARWKLIEYQGKTKKHTVVKKEENIVENTETSNHRDETKYKLDLPEFTNKIELQDYVRNEYLSIKSKSIVIPLDSTKIVKSIDNYFKTTLSEDTIQETAQFLNDEVFLTVSDIRDKFSESGNKNQVVAECILQVQLRLEVMKYLKSDAEKQEFINPIVSFLRCISFEENTFFLRNHLNTVILPTFSSTLSNILYEIYDEMMLEIPIELENKTKDISNKKNEEENKQQDNDEADEEEDKQIILPSSVSCYSSDNSSVASVRSERRVLRRHSSVVNENTSSRRMIAVEIKTKSRKKRRKDSTTSFHKPNVPPTTPKLKRRHSEMSLRKRVPDTPEGKQISDMIWKKQERDRRHSNVDKNMAPIKESPLKENSSPIKRRSLCQRSSSFSVRSSPRRFYTVNNNNEKVKELSSATNKKNTTKFQRYATFSENMLQSNQPENTEQLDEFSPQKTILQTPLEVKLRRRSTLFSNFQDLSPYKSLLNEPCTINSVKLEKKDSGIEGGEEEDPFENLNRKSLETEPKPPPRRNIFSQRNSSETSSTNTISFESISSSGSIKRLQSPVLRESKKMKLSTDENGVLLNSNFHSIRQSETMPAFPSSFIESKGKSTSVVSLDLKKTIDDQTNSQLNRQDETDYVSESTQDWLTQIEEEQKIQTPTALSFRDAFEKVSRTPNRYSVKNSPTVIKTRDGPISVSPCLSASSVDFLEKAPFLSPVNTKRNTKLRKNIVTDYTGDVQ